MSPRCCFGPNLICFRILNASTTTTGINYINNSKQICGSLKALNLVVWWKVGLYQQNAEDIVNSTNDMLNFTILWQGVRIGHSKDHNLNGQEKLHGRVIELIPIIALNDLNGAAKLTGDINSLNGALKDQGPLRC